MRILDRYSLRAYAAVLLWCLTVFLGLYLVLDLLNHLDEILRYRVPISVLATYYLASLPLIFVQTVPFACLMACMYVLSHLNRNREIMAMRAAGLSPFAIARPFLWMGVVLSFAVFLVNEVVVPNAASTTQRIKDGYLSSPPPNPNNPKRSRTQQPIEHLAAYGTGHTLLYARRFDPISKTMSDVVVLQHGENLRLLRKVTAKQAVWTGTGWRFLDGTILHFTPEGHPIGRAVPFTAKSIPILDRPEILGRSETQALFMNMRDLAHYIKKIQAAARRSGTVQKLKVELYAKPAMALACLVLTVIGIPFAIQPIRGGPALGLSLGLAIGLAFYGSNALFIALGKGGWIPPPMAAWGAPVIFGLLGIFLTQKRLA
jgi:lipopolysaccharide export system permease protein